jgi:hypothetical protein
MMKKYFKKLKMTDTSHKDPTMDYQTATNIYKKIQKIHNKTLYELIQEADEEEQGIRWKNRKLKNRLIHFRNYLLDNYTKTTVTKFIMLIKVIYDTFEIEIGKLPKYNK